MLSQEAKEEFGEYFGINFDMPEKKKLKKNKNKDLVIADIHVPYHNVKAFDKTINDNLDCENLYIIGDWFDFYSKSRFRHTKSVNFRDEFRKGFNLLKTLSCRFNKIYFMIANHDCFDTETEILTKEGWKKYNEFDKNSELATYNMESNYIEYQKPTDIYRDIYDGEFYYLKTRGIDLATTPNHRYLYRPSYFNKANKSWKLEAVQDIWMGENRLTFKASGKMDSCFRMHENIIKIVGWLLTDGSLQWKGKSPTIVFYQAQKKLHLITDILDKLHLTYRINERKNTTKEIRGVIIKTQQKQYSIHLDIKSARFITEFISNKKRIPEWVYKLSDEQFEIFLNSVIDGDGSRHKAHPKTSLMVYGIKEFLDQLQHACIIHGYRTSISTYREKDYRLNITKNETVCADRVGRSLTKKNYNGIIWCATVPNSTLIVRRNGRAIICGNSRFEKWLYDNVHPEALEFCNTKITENILTCIPNLELLSQPVNSHREIGYIIQVKNVIFTHIEKSNIDITKTVQEIDKYFARWGRTFNLNDFDGIIQAHNHSSGKVRLGDKFLFQIPCLIDISSFAFDYVFSGKAIGNPPALGYIVLIKDKDNPNKYDLKKTVITDL
jgi:hypothetical protein